MYTVCVVWCMNCQQVSWCKVIFTFITYKCPTGTIPWSGIPGDTIKQSVSTEGVSLPLDRKTLPADLYQVLSKGLQANPQHRTLDLHEIQDVFHNIKVILK